MSVEAAVVYPKIPARLMGAGGMIRIVMQSKVVYKGADCWGTWDESTRTIQICSGATPAHQWRVLFHEAAHAALADTGVECLLNDEAVEMLCEAFATARMRERFG